ncbi:hypothetical protein E4U17_003129 [Claviceps sp. LM77 group G4]|nr:hypothetical protein E4U17_003129 [Claviceps sp. LM77 group G4]KAG6081027.1 hypothetical protein E4U16_007912 [Claviceps sp. LM84 group G4]
MGDTQRAPLIHDTGRTITDLLSLHRADTKDTESMCVEVFGIEVEVEVEVEVDTRNKQARPSSKKAAKANSLITSALTPTTVTLRRFRSSQASSNSVQRQYQLGVRA